MREYLKTLALAFLLPVVACMVLLLVNVLWPRHSITAPHVSAQPEWVAHRNFAPMIGRTADGTEFTCPVPLEHTTAAIQACRERVYRYNERLGPGHVGWVFVNDGTLIGDGDGIPHNYLTGNVLIASMKDRH